MTGVHRYVKKVSNLFYFVHLTQNVLALKRYWCELLVGQILAEDSW